MNPKRDLIRKGFYGISNRIYLVAHTTCFKDYKRGVFMDYAAGEVPNHSFIIPKSGLWANLLTPLQKGEFVW
jgi:hypothetical protein